MTTVGVIIPTVEGREDHLGRCLKAYAATVNTPFSAEIIVIKDRETCGIAWAEGLARLSPTIDYVHYTADDLEPIDGWLEAAVAASALGEYPAPLIHQPNMVIESCGSYGKYLPDGATPDYVAVPFMSYEIAVQAGPSIPLHYFTDNWMELKAVELGLRPVVRHEYRFIHHRAEAGRGASHGSEQNRLSFDRKSYQNYINGNIEWPPPDST